MLNSAITRASLLKTVKSILNLIMHVSLWTEMLHLASKWHSAKKRNNNKSHLGICSVFILLCLEKIYLKFIQENINV